MFYKIFDNENILDVINNPLCVKTLRNGARVGSSRKDAEGVLSSDTSRVWYVKGWCKRPVEGLVSILEITQMEYELLKDSTVLAKSKKAQNEVQETPPAPTLEDVTTKTIKERKIEIANKTCAKKIVEGVNVVLRDGQEYHFDMTLEDQINLLSLQALLDSNMDPIPYHAKGSVVKMYSKQDIQTILNAVQQHRIYHTTYVNALKYYINHVDDINVLAKIYYGMEIPVEYQPAAAQEIL